MKAGLMMAALVAVVAVAPARADEAAANKGANAVYERMQAAYAAHDRQAMESVYAPDATYLSRHGKLDIHRREQLRQGMDGTFDHLKKSGGQVDMKFRIVERKHYGNVIIDNGYVRTTMKMSKDAPAQVTTGKFVTAIVKQPQGHWAFVTDADADTPAEAFDKAAPVAGLKFDK